MSGEVSLSSDEFGSYKNAKGVVEKVTRFTWKNKKTNTTVQVIDWGATVTSIRVPDKYGEVEDVVTGFDTIAEYLSPDNNCYYGATIGRVANRIAKGQMTINGIGYKLATNNGPNHLHGGIRGFDKVLWNYHVNGTKLVLTYHSPDMEEGYPGDLLATVIFELTPDNQLEINYHAIVSKTTPVNLTNHSYFNLAGHGAGPQGLYQHKVAINADRITEVDGAGIPTGKLLDVTGTTFDLRVARMLKDVIGKVPASPGYDHNYCVNKPSHQNQVGFVAQAVHRPSGRTLEVYSDQPGVQFYTGNFMPEDGSSRGKGAVYTKHGAFCLETQIFPDAVHHANFPSALVHPGEEYRHFVSYKFLVEK